MEEDLTTISGRPIWTRLEEKRGIDPLGMQSTSVSIYQGLVPGLSNVTLRMRYYGLYAWLTKRYARDVGSTAVVDWQRYLRRAEALYALAAKHNTGDQGVAGSLWAGRALAKSGAVTFAANTDPTSGEPQYLKQKFGAFGAAYGSQLEEIGILFYPEHEIPVPTKLVGNGLADAFADSLGEAEDLFLECAHRGRVSRAQLEAMAAIVPSAIAKSSDERRRYEDILFARGQQPRTGDIRRQRTLGLVLQVANELGRRPSVSEVRWALYSGCADSERMSSVSPEQERHRLSWEIYQANDLAQVCLSAVFKFTLDVLGSYESGMPLEHLVGEVTRRIVSAMKPAPATWQHLVESLKVAPNAWSQEDLNSDFMLTGATLEATDPRSVCDADGAADALRLLATVYKRFSPLTEVVEQELQGVSDGPFVQSLLTEIKYLASAANDPFEDTLRTLIRTRILDRHLWVAIQKLRFQKDYTFLFEADNGRVRLRQKDSPVLTTPRLGPALTFLGDIHLLNEEGLTKAGRAVLGEM